MIAGSEYAKSDLPPKMSNDQKEQETEVQADMDREMLNN